MKALAANLRTFAHITGGGLASNTARVIPASLTATFNRSTWSLPLATQILADLGGISQEACESTWNCGVGMVAVIEPDSADLALKTLAARGMRAWIAGEIFPDTTNYQASLIGGYRK
jgi:phosphoribosylformylglycinamidine cyclo-ligase